MEQGARPSGLPLRVRFGSLRPVGQFGGNRWGSSAQCSEGGGMAEGRDVSGSSAWGSVGQFSVTTWEAGGGPFFQLSPNVMVEQERQRVRGRPH